MGKCSVGKMGNINTISVELAVKKMPLQGTSSQTK
jgi:hypothetical protein